MSWRINFWKLSNEEYRKFSCSTEEDYRDKGHELVDSFGELIWSDTMTELIGEDNASGKCLFSSRVFKFDTDETYFGVVSKNQFKNLILACRQKIIQYLHETDAPGYVQLLINEWEFHLVNKDRDFYASINFDNKYLVSNSPSYESAIFNLLHIFKLVDWEEEVLVCVGW